MEMQAQERILYLLLKRKINRCNQSSKRNSLTSKPHKGQLFASIVSIQGVMFFPLGRTNELIARDNCMNTKVSEFSTLL